MYVYSDLGLTIGVTPLTIFRYGRQHQFTKGGHFYILGVIMHESLSWKEHGSSMGKEDLF